MSQKKLISEILTESVVSSKSWGNSYKYLPQLINKFNLKKGIEIGVAYGGHAETILNSTKINTLYGVDPYLHFDGFNDPMNFNQHKFNMLYKFTKKRLSRFGKRYRHIRMSSDTAANKFKDDSIDFIYIDADHSYDGVNNDLCLWFSKVKDGGIISGHDYGHINFPGVKKAIDEFFERFDWNVNSNKSGFWWVEKKQIPISFIVPAYNCEKYITKAVESIMKTNFSKGDEVVICNDASTDKTELVIKKLIKKYPNIKYVKHVRNKGGGAARNTAIENTSNELIFCLDSDNILVEGSIIKLKDFLINTGSDIAAFQELHYFVNSIKEVTHKWIFKPGKFTIEDYLSGIKVPGASGNYLFTKKSWINAEGYPEYAGSSDTWGFGFQQLITGSKMMVMEKSFYFHRYGYESYWVRESRKNNLSLNVLRIIIPFLDFIRDEDIEYIFSPKGRYIWFENLDKHPIRLKNNDTLKKRNCRNFFKLYFNKLVRIILNR